MVVGPGLRWVWPARWGARSVLPASARVRPPFAFLGWVPLPDALVGRPPKRMGRRRPSCGGNGAGTGGPKDGPPGTKRPGAVSPSWGFRPIPCRSWPYGQKDEKRTIKKDSFPPTKNVEKCRILPHVVTSCKIVGKHVHRRRTPCASTEKQGIFFTWYAFYRPNQMKK